MKHLYIFLLFAIGPAKAQEQQFTVYFDFNIANANVSSTEALTAWAAENKKAKIVKIYGYADSSGSDAYNLRLSEQRVNNVLRQLHAAGITMAADIKVQGFGESKSTGVQVAEDRKVEIFYLKPVVSELEEQINAAVKGDKIRLQNLNFYENSVEMLPEAKPVLDDLLRILKEKQSLRIDIQGHVCCQPENEEKLSFRRAYTIYTYLVNRGIDPDRLTHTGFGSTRPIYPLPEKNLKEIRANRRVEIEIVSL